MQDIGCGGPQPLSASDWAELSKLDFIRQSWGLHDSTEPARDLAAMAHAARFDFSCLTQPGYCGDLYILVGDAFDEPCVIVRSAKGELAEASQSRGRPAKSEWDGLADDGSVLLV